MLLTFKRAFKWAYRRVNLTIQPPLLPGRLKEGRYLSPAVGVMDRGESGDQDALGLRFIRWMEGKILSNILLLVCCKGVHCGISHDNIVRILLLVSIMMPLDWGKYNIQQSARIRVVSV